MTELRIVRAGGTPRERGQQVGRGLGQIIERSLGFYHQYLERRGIASRQLQDFLAPFFTAAEAQTPAYAETIKGMAEGAMVPVWELFAVNAFEELEPLLGSGPEHPSFIQTDAGSAPTRRPHVQPDRCSTFAISGPGFTLLGHNEQWLAGDQGNVAVIVDVPGRGLPAVVSPTVVCCLPAVGMNEYGGVQGIQSLVAADDGVGVPRVLVSRHSLEASDRLDAVRRAAMPHRAGGYGHVFAFRGGDTFIVETTATQHSLLSGSGPHTNHYLDPALGEAGPPPSMGSVSRYERLLALIEERHPETPEGVMDILRDHGSRPQAICRHPDPREGDDAASVLFSMVCDVEAGLMWVAPGNPCSTEYQEVDLTGVFAAS
ncbi:MAG TPA: C45 family peptidase [Actinomycetota bacterium]